MYKNILKNQIEQYNHYYKKVCKMFPSVSIKDKKALTIKAMSTDRHLDPAEALLIRKNPFQNSLKYQYFVEMFATSIETDNGIDRYYIKDESLFEFFKNTEIKPKEVQSILDSDVLEKPYGVIGQNMAFVLICLDFPKGQTVSHAISVLTDDMNYTFCLEDCDDTENRWVFNMAMNFLFYINAFPECVIDGVPNGVKRSPKAKSISLSEKIVSHTTVEHGFVRPHFRSGYFRHLNSDYFVNCKGQVRFIASTMVKGKAKTVISKE